MHLFLIVFVITAAFIWGDWKNWYSYYPTMLFVALASILYNLLAANYWLWKYEPIPQFSYIITDLAYSFLVLPGATILYLSHIIGKESKKKVFYIFKWVICSSIVESIYYHFDMIHYFHGWNVYYSLMFYTVMYTIIYIHFRKPLLAIALSIPFTVFLIFFFDVPAGTPIELR
ncbi:hypothetical protein CVD25_14315 [Bacillus canaveralius]|uniref:Uncharacterized protein n=1 Tax=Bacillus canaveralius TaxID=1403243 RepID=A0A2N5GLJ9_9BACI|nr:MULTISPECIES: CBO0543 family protein [Bacillus]PLR82515.1 hypothetical protein CU635_11980 [Bacillus canaveralius]PLR87142.1 hypothetical protein CVD23_03970 [Bacillus sp. V33-4]PLR95686.1 hypothetical protein CVD25_14315 [Bacillus canaveralius]RSK45584.1 hypothetical protein EJA13_19360 [Bacillus canaveralius]